MVVPYPTLDGGLSACALSAFRVSIPLVQLMIKGGRGISEEVLLAVLNSFGSHLRCDGFLAFAFVIASVRLRTER